MEIKVFVGSQIMHLSQIYTGLAMLEERKIVNLQFIPDQSIPWNSPLLRMEVNGKMVVFDLADSNKILNRAIYDHSDFYFKRMLPSILQEKLPKIFPYGLNYAVFHLKDKFLKRNLISGNTKNLFFSFARRLPFLAGFLNINLSYSNCLVHHFESVPQLKRNTRIIYYTRLWNPSNVKEKDKKEERERMNSIRIALVKGYMKRFGNRFLGGIIRTPYSKEIGGDTVLNSNKEAHKTRYLENLRISSIGIADPGLEMSIGWKFAEYVAMSKAIISSPINTLLPGNFQVGQNYIGYDTIGDCIAICEELIGNQNRILDLQQNNHQYYNQYLKPDVLLYNCLSKVL